MMAKSFTRRKILTLAVNGAAGLVAAHTLGGCQTLDHYFLETGRREEREVLIVGGGLSGLISALELKKNQIPFRVFESRSEWGGWARTRRFQWQDQIELFEQGIEYFSSRDTLFLELLDEMRIKYSELPKNSYSESLVFSVNGRWVSLQSQLASFKSFQKLLGKIENPGAYSKDVSLQTFLDSVTFQYSDEFRSSLGLFLKDEYGAALNLIPASVFLSTVNEDGSSLLSSRINYRLNNGFSDFARTLVDRIQNAIPNQTTQLGHQLVKIVKKDKKYELTFKTSSGLVTVSSPRVIMAISPAEFRKVDGWKQALSNPGLVQQMEEMVFTRKVKHSVLVESNKKAELKIRSGQLLSSSPEFRVNARPLKRFSRISGGGTVATAQLLTFQFVENASDVNPLESVQKALDFLKEQKWMQNAEVSELFLSNPMDFRDSQFLAQPGLLAQQLLDDKSDGLQIRWAHEAFGLSQTKTIEASMEASLAAAQSIIKTY